MSIEVRGLESARVMLTELREEMPEAAREATKNLVYAVWNGIRTQVVADFDRPVQWTVGAIRYQVNASDKGPGGRVYIVDQFRANAGADETHYLGVNTLGGVRRRSKASEIALEKLGIMPHGFVWAPDRSVKLDKNGNVPAKAIRVMLEEFRQWGKKMDPSRQFYARGNHGVFMRVGDQFYPFIWFISPRRYEKLFDFYGRADRDISYSFDEIYNKSINLALERAAARSAGNG